MARSNGGKAKAFFRANPSGAFDQYLQDIQKLPLIKDPAEERRLARRVQRGDEKAAERLVTATSDSSFPTSKSIKVTVSISPSWSIGTKGSSKR